MVVFIFYVWVFIQPEVPLKADEEFECKLNLSFKSRDSAGQPDVNYVETISERDKRLSGSPLPYLKLKLKFLVLKPEEVRMQALAAGSLLRGKKIEVGEEIDLDLGFTSDIKDGIIPKEYVVLLLSKDRKSVSQITISFTKEGDYLVNGVKRGRI